MLSASLAVAALSMGLAGGPHCIGMCGAPCAAGASQVPKLIRVVISAPLVMASTIPLPQPLR